jgi:hypothetical protein
MTTPSISYPQIIIGKETPNTKRNLLNVIDQSIHDWYRFVLSYPPQLVRKYLSTFQVDMSQRVLDPFCGTGTTNVECKLHNLSNVGLELNPFPYFASKVKTHWDIDPVRLVKNSEIIANIALSEIKNTGFIDSQYTEDYTSELLSLSEASENLLINDSISPIPKHKSIILLDTIRKYSEQEFINHQELAFAKTLVFQASNLTFGPEVGVGKIKLDVAIVSKWIIEIKKMAQDIQEVENNNIPTDIYQGDSREVSQYLEPRSIDAVITSPPYPNEKDYTRTTRLESVFLNFINNKDDLRSIKSGLVRSNTRGIYKADKDYEEIEDISEIMELAHNIENRRIELGKTSGFEKMYHKVTLNYFGGMALHFKDLRSVLKPGARLAYVVGDQASYFRILIKTGELLSVVAKKYGFEVEGIDLFRTRLATSTRTQLREEVLLLRWPG